MTWRFTSSSSVLFETWRVEAVRTLALVQLDVLELRPRGDVFLDLDVREANVALRRGVSPRTVAEVVAARRLAREHGRRAIEAAIIAGSTAERVRAMMPEVPREILHDDRRRRRRAFN